ncbi:MAG TPA: PIN domain-containing protein [Bryobacteraceae bacterium]
MKPILLDTGVIVALLDRSEKRHRHCVEVIHGLAAPLLTCEAVIAEACYLLRRLPGAPEAVLENVTTGAFQIPLQLSHSAPAIQRILRKYKDREVDLADACLVHLAATLQTPEILTLDRDFEVYRWGGSKPFHFLIPPIA